MCLIYMNFPIHSQLRFILNLKIFEIQISRETISTCGCGTNMFLFGSIINNKRRNMFIFFDFFFVARNIQGT